MIHLTENAQEHLSNLISKTEHEKAIRFAVQGAGCSGYAIRCTFARDPEEDDTIFEQGPVKIYVDPISVAYIDEMKVDLVEHGLNQVLGYEIPNSVGKCGCGESFSF